MVRKNEEEAGCKIFVQKEDFCFSCGHVNTFIPHLGSKSMLVLSCCHSKAQIRMIGIASLSERAEIRCVENNSDKNIAT